MILRARGRKRRSLSLLKDRRSSLGRGVEVKGFLGREHCVYFQKSFFKLMLVAIDFFSPVARNGVGSGVLVFFLQIYVQMGEQ